MAMKKASSQLENGEIKAILGLISMAISFFESVGEKVDSVMVPYYYEWIGDLWRYRLHFTSNEDTEALQASRVFYLKALSKRPGVGRISAEMGILAYKGRDYLGCAHFLYRALWSERQTSAHKLINDLFQKVKPPTNLWLGCLFKCLRNLHKGKDIEGKKLISTFKQQFPDTLPQHHIFQTTICLSVILIANAAEHSRQLGKIIELGMDLANVLLSSCPVAGIVLSFLLLEYIYRESLSSCLPLIHEAYWCNLSKALNKLNACQHTQCALFNLAAAFKGFTLLEFEEDVTEMDWQEAVNSIGCDVQSIICIFLSWCGSQAEPFLVKYLVWDGKHFHCQLDHDKCREEEQSCPKIPSMEFNTDRCSSICSMDLAMENLKIKYDYGNHDNNVHRMSVNDVPALLSSHIVFDTNILLFRLELVKEALQRYSDLYILIPLVVLRELENIRRRRLGDQSVMAERALTWLASPNTHSPDHVCTQRIRPVDKTKLGSRILTVTSNGDLLPGIQAQPASKSFFSFPINIANNDDMLLSICKKVNPVLLVTDDLNLINKARVHNLPVKNWREFSRAFL